MISPVHHVAQLVVKDHILQERIRKAVESLESLTEGDYGATHEQGIEVLLSTLTDSGMGLVSEAYRKREKINQNRWIL